MTAALLTAAVGEVWAMAELPDDALSQDEWRQLFAVAGYTENGRRVARPAAPVRLWRGAEPQFRARGSWTGTRAVAETYASGSLPWRTRGAVWTAVVPPQLIFARVSMRDEDEYVIDARTLQIELDVLPDVLVG